MSNVSTEKWEPDPEVGGEMHVPSGARLEAGLSRFTQSLEPIEWTPTERETILVLEGETTIELAGGPTLELKAGDIASIPPETPTTWHITPQCKELWLIS